MNKNFYRNIAWTNLKKNANVYLPFVLTAIGTIIMVYNSYYLTYQKTEVSGSVSTLLGMTIGITIIFAFIFLFYTNSFLVKRRKKEWGLYNILGMEKKHIARISMWENIFVASFCIITGVILGIVFSNFFTLILYKILNIPPKINYGIYLEGVKLTVIFFLIIFFLLLVHSIITVYRAKTLDLLYGDNIGEKEPKSSWLVAIIGVISLGAGYSLSMTTKNPMTMIPMFFGAVILVIIGTYCLFTSGSIAFLKLLKRNKKYYYKTNHFTSVSGMIYRMKQNAVGLANICIMSTAVLVMISTTVSLYVGKESMLDKRFEYDVTVSMQSSNEDTDVVETNLKNHMGENEIPYANYKSLDILDFSESKGDVTDQYGTFVDAVYYRMITKSDYEKYTGEEITPLAENEVVIYEKNNDPKLANSITITDKTYTVKGHLEKNLDGYNGGEIMFPEVTVIVPDRMALKAMSARKIEITGNDYYGIKRDIMFDYDEKDENKKEILDSKIRNYLSENRHKIENGDIVDSLYWYITKYETKESFMFMYGELFFIGIFLGFLFLMATVLIIYYKQIIEGFDDRKRFEIMQKVGMSHKEVKKSIRSQILTVFALPIVVAAIHLAVAFPILVKLLNILGLSNNLLFAQCAVITVLVFATVYTIIYMLTSRVYYKIINK